MAVFLLQHTITKNWHMPYQLGMCSSTAYAQAEPVKYS